MRFSVSNLVSTIILGLVLMGLSGWSQSVWALDLQQAKSQGLVGERLDGYLGIVKPSDRVQALVKKINLGRREHYKRIAQQTGTSRDVVEVLAGKKAIQKTPAGQYIQNASGAWIKK